MKDEILAQIAQNSHRSKMAVRDILIEGGHKEALADYDKNMWDIETGVMGARATWNALSKTQRKVMVDLENKGVLHRIEKIGADIWACCVPRQDLQFVLGVCKLPTVKNLLARQLLDCQGGPADPLRILHLSAHGEFVLKRGRECPKLRPQMMQENGT